MQSSFYGVKLDKYNDLYSFANSNNTQGIIENGRICDFATKINTDLSNIDNFIYTINQNTKCINSYIYINGDLFPIIHNENESELLKKAKEIYISIIENTKNLTLKKDESFTKLYNIDITDYKQQINRVFIDLKTKDTNKYEVIGYKTYIEIINQSIPYGILDENISANNISLMLLKNKQIIEKIYYIENEMNFEEYINLKLRKILVWEEDYTDEMYLYKEMLLEELEKERVITNEKKFSDYNKYINKKCAIHCDKIKTGFVRSLDFKSEEPIMILENSRTIHKINLKEIKKITIIE